MDSIGRQFLSIWKGLKLPQKGMFFAILFFGLMILGYLIFKTSSTHTTSLFPIGSMAAGNDLKIREYLEKKGIPFEEKKEMGFLVPKDTVHELRLELATLGIPNHEPSQGFELFDTNTWIKGEKELQVLEIRALKGQLEKDICEYEAIKSARVILDIAPPRALSGVVNKSKASVILSLKPSARLSLSQLRAITYHVAGAVRGLEPHQIAISDTTGKFYQAFHSEGHRELGEDVRFIEDLIYEKMEGLLKKMVGDDHFYLSVQSRVNPATQKVELLSGIVYLDNSLITENHPESMWRKILEEPLKVSEGYGIKTMLSIHTIPLLKSPQAEIEKTSKNSFITLLGLLLTIFIVVMALFSMLPLFKWVSNRKKNPEKKKEEALFRFVTQLDVDQLANSIKDEDPAAIALLLSYLEPRKAEKILRSLPDQVQERIVQHLSNGEC